ncbi:hypothetical protein MFIFM68171_10647 [Madurella fahalii]|uniref:Uncharacterized protein n=1 Tax=Madurella fahalii TaxID=1157608 RepID=A0ABQ0GRT1_9PEZI
MGHLSVHNKYLILLAAATALIERVTTGKVGEIESIEILHRNDGSSPVHQSCFNPDDKELVISARITPADGSKPKTHHIYVNGTGTIKKGDKREYSTSARSLPGNVWGLGGPSVDLDNDHGTSVVK